VYQIDIERLIQRRACTWRIATWYSMQQEVSQPRMVRIITTSATTTGVIIAKPLTVMLDDYPLITKIYEGSAAATLHVDNYSLGSIVYEDDV